MLLAARVLLLVVEWSLIGSMEDDLKANLPWIESLES